VAVATASPTLGQQFEVLANVSVLLSLYSYTLAGGSLVRLSVGLGKGRQIPAQVTALAAIVCCIALIASGKRVELEIALIPIAAAGLLYLWLRRR
jgi:hypothetical protein